MVVHELVARLADATPSDRERCAVFAEALAAYRRRAWPETMRLWQDSDDGPSRFHLRWCEDHAGQPPATDWDGVVRMEQK